MAEDSSVDIKVPFPDAFETTITDDTTRTPYNGKTYSISKIESRTGVMTTEFGRDIERIMNHATKDCSLVVEINIQADLVSTRSDTTISSSDESTDQVKPIKWCGCCIKKTRRK